MILVLGSEHFSGRQHLYQPSPAARRLMLLGMKTLILSGDLSREQLQATFSLRLPQAMTPVGPAHCPWFSK